MIRKLMILVLIGLLGYIFYGEFVADTIEPFLQQFKKKPLFYQVRDPKAVFEDPAQQLDPALSGIAPGQTEASPQQADAAPAAVPVQAPLEQPADLNAAQGQAQ